MTDSTTSPPLTNLIPEVSASAEGHDDRDGPGVLVHSLKPDNIGVRHELQGTCTYTRTRNTKT